jgi:hypothetical protein
MSGDPAAASPHPHLVILNASTMAYVGSWLDNTVYGEAIASPALGRDKKIYVCTHEYTDKNNAFSHIYAINVTDPAHPAGLWGYPAGCLGTIVASPVIAADGKIYVCTRDGAMGGGTAHVPVIICFDPASATPQTPIWTCTTGGFRPIDGTPAIGRIGDLYVPNDLNNSTSLSAMDPSAQTDGNDYVPEWDFSLTVEKFDSGPVVAADETVFAKSILEASPHTATFREISNGADVADATVGNDTLAWHLHPDDGAGIDAVFSSPAIAVNGKIYVATAGSDNGATPPIPTGGGTISCFDTGTSAPGFWPNYRGNQYNTGNAQDNKWTTNSVISASIQQLLSYPYSGAASANAVNNGGKTVGSRFNGSWSAAGSWTVTSQYPSSMSGLSGYPVYAAYGINDTQQAAGSDFDQYGLPHHALFWSTLSATPIDLTPTGFSISQGYAIDPIARIAGAAKQSSSPNAWHAIRWDSGDPANAKDLGTLKSALGAYSYAYGINAHGTVVGKSQTDSPGHYFAFSMPSTRNSLLPTDNLEPTSSLDNASYAVNSAGQIVGG